MKDFKKHNFKKKNTIKARVHGSVAFGNGFARFGGRIFRR